jgi:predicted CDP-diglyceride synthetase/phosphatidate cytidylyltransferase
MSALETTTVTTRTARPRPPASVVAATGLTGLVAALGAYGAVYFTGLEGFTDLGLTFLVTYEFITLGGLVAAVALARRSELGRVGVVAYGVWMTVFTVFKVGYIHELEAIPFGVVGAAVLALASTRSARRYTRGE